MAAHAAFNGRGAMLQALGIDLNFGIVADITADPGSFIYERSMGGCRRLRRARVAAAVTGEYGHVLSTLKHFPGHGVSPGDSHCSIPGTAISMDEWQAGHAPPFAAGIDAGPSSSCSATSASTRSIRCPRRCPPMWHQMLRDDLGFDGIIITDDMAMLENSGEPAYADRLTNAIAASMRATRCCSTSGRWMSPGLVTGIAAAVRDGTLDEALIDDAARRLLELRRELSGQTGRFSHCFAECQAMVE